MPNFEEKIEINPKIETFSHESSNAEISIDNNRKVCIRRLYSEEKGRGHGSALLNELKKNILTMR